MRKKICFLTDSIFSVGGVQRVTSVIANHLAKDYDVTIVTFDEQIKEHTNVYGLDQTKITCVFFSYPAVGWLHEKCCKAYSALYKNLGLQSRWASRLYALSSFPGPRRKALRRLLADGGYDTIIGVHAGLASRLATVRGQLKGVRCIGWIHNSFDALFGPTSLYIGSVLKRHYVYQFQRLDCTVVLSQFDADRFKQYDCRLQPTVIYNPLTLKPGRLSDGTSKRFLAVGRFSHKHKGFDLLIDAFHLFAKHNSEWMLDIVGEGPEESLYRQMLAGYGLEERVRLHPFTNNVQEYYSNAQIYVLSSRWEGFGLVLVEAMAHGLPVVSSNLPTSQEIMGDFALYFENGNVEQLAQCLLEVTQIDWQQKKEEALAIAARFDTDKIIEQWKQLLGSSQSSERGNA